MGEYLYFVSTIKKKKNLKREWEQTNLTTEGLPLKLSTLFMAGKINCFEKIWHVLCNQDSRGTVTTSKQTDESYPRLPSHWLNQTVLLWNTPTYFLATIFHHSTTSHLLHRLLLFPSHHCSRWSHRHIWGIKLSQWCIRWHTKRHSAVL